MFNVLLTLLFNGGIVTKGVMLALSIGLLLSVGSCSYKAIELTSTQHKVQSLEANVATLTANTAVFKANQDTLKSTNDTNVATINKLIKERNDAQVAINNLAKQKATEHVRAETANKRIDDLLKNPNNNAPVAPVLRETLKEYNR